MASKSTVVRKEGYLWVKTKRHPSVTSLKTWQWKYCVLKKCSGYQHNVCLEWYENREAFLDDSSPKNKLRFNLIKLVGNFEDKKKEFAFFIYKSSNEQLHLATKTEAERIEWTDILNQFTGKDNDRSPSVSTTTDPTCLYKFPKPQTLPMNVDDSKTSYPVKFQDSTLSPGCLKIKGDYFLQVGSKHVSLWTVGAGKEPQRNILCWSMATIKSYYSRPVETNPSMKILTIETGRQSSTGSGDFHFLTRFGEEIKSNIRLNTKRTLYEQKKHSSESIPFDVPYSSSPERSSFHWVPYDPNTPRRTSVKSPDRATIPFDKYDEEPTDGGSFATYIPHENGYIHVLTPQEDVDKFHRKGSRKSCSGHESSISDDSAYIKVLGEDEQSAPVYLEVLGEYEEKSVQETNDEDEGTSLQPNKDREEFLQESDDEGEKSVQEHNGKYKSVEENNDDRGISAQEKSVQETNETLEPSSAEVVQKPDHENQFFLDLKTGTPRWQSQTSNTSSAEYSSVSSENDVFSRDRDPSISDVFPEEVAKLADNHRTHPEKNNNELKSPSRESCESSAHSQDESRDTREERVSEEEARMPEADSVDGWPGLTGNDMTETSEGHDDSTSSASDGGGGNVEESGEVSDEEAMNNGNSSRRNSLPRQSFSGVRSFERQRSFTTNDLQDLLKRVASAQDELINDEELARDLEPQSPEDALGLNINFKNTIVDQLTNPTAVQPSSGSYPKRGSRHSAGEIKYVCSECGWYKRSRKKSVWKKEKKCERCSRVIQKSSYSMEQKEPKSPKKDKSIRLLSRFTRRLTERNSESSETLREDIKPVKPVPQPSFVKNLHTHFATHNPTLDSKRSEIGIAPSPFHALAALSIAGETRTPRSSIPAPNDESSLPLPKTALTSSKSEGALASCQISPRGTKRTSPTNQPHQTLTKSLTCDFGKVAINPLTRTQSSPPPCNESEQPADHSTTELRAGDEQPPRKLSGANLPPLPEGGSIESADPPAIPPRTREERPPLPPRRNPGAPSRKGGSAKLRRIQTDPSNPSGRTSPRSPVDDQPKIRSLTDPWNNGGMGDTMGHVVSVREPLDNNEETKPIAINVTSRSVDEDLDGSPPPSTPPPLPPRKTSVPLMVSRRVSDDAGRLNRSYDQTELSSSLELSNLPENGYPGSPKTKPPLTSKRSLEAKRNFKTRNPMYSERVDDSDEINLN